MYNLFLDDQRMPKNAFIYPKRKTLEEVSGIPNDSWVIVRTYDEFVDMIKQCGMPQNISFDHDLHEEHIFHYFSHTQNTGFIEYENFKHKTGKHCAEFVVSISEDIDTKPNCFIHSANAYGREEIAKVLSEL